MSRDLRSQADWLASEGFLAVAPNLYYWGRRTTCLTSFVRASERPLSDLNAARAWLAVSEAGLILPRIEVPAAALDHAA